MKIQSIPTLTYHKIDFGFELGLNKIHPSKFNKHIQLLSKKGYKAITTKCEYSSKKVFITFDDGYQNVLLNALPIMQKVKFKGIIFVSSNFIGKINNWDINFGLNKNRHLSKVEIQELSNNGWEIASHGHNHYAYSKLKLSEIREDLIKSKNILEDLTGKEVISFTSPFNIMPKEVWELLSEVGYKNIFIQKSLFSENNKEFRDLNIIERRSVYCIDSSKNIQKKILNSSKFELIKENTIHSCSKLTVYFKKIEEANLLPQS